LRVLERPSPLAFPLIVEFLREKLSTEKLADRIARMLADLESAAGPSPDYTGPMHDMPPGVDAACVAEQARFGMSDHTGPAGPRKPRRTRKPSRPLPLL
jgi:ATP-dependent Lhr-like helicase